MPYFIIRKADETDRDSQYAELCDWQIDSWLTDLAVADHVIGPIALPADAHQRKNAIDAEGTIADQTCVKFYADEKERDDWRVRERQRFASGEYILPPWRDLESSTLRELHFVHLSRKTPGMVAYTVSEEHGVRDRQTTIRPGRYLSQFYPNMPKEKIDRFCGMCSIDSLELQVTNEPDDIVAGYTARNAPDSCMSHSIESYSGDCHPVAVYGGAGSDLALAYIGSIKEQHIRARAIVWPSHKLYSRVYGDRHLLIAALERDGWSEGEMDGAKIRAIRSGSGWIMPYVDNIENCELSRNGQSFILGDGRYSCGETCGYVREKRDPDFTCERCETDCYDGECENVLDDGSYCDGCYDRVARTCHECDTTFDRNRETFTTIRRDHVVCSSCARDAERTCNREECDDTWYDGDNLEHGANDDLCSDCADTFEYCPHCSDLTEKDSETCDECAEPIVRRCEHTADLPLADTPAEPAPIVIVIDPPIIHASDLHRDFDRVIMFPDTASEGSVYCCELRGRVEDHPVEPGDDPTGRIWTTCYMVTDDYASEPAISADCDRIVRQCRELAERHPNRVYRVRQVWTAPPSSVQVLQIGAVRNAPHDPFVIVDRWNPNSDRRDRIGNLLEHNPSFHTPDMFSPNVELAQLFDTIEEAERTYQTYGYHTSQIVRLSVVRTERS